MPSPLAHGCLQSLQRPGREIRGRIWQGNSRMHAQTFPHEKAHTPRHLTEFQMADGPTV